MLVKLNLINYDLFDLPNEFVFSFVSP